MGKRFISFAGAIIALAIPALVYWLHIAWLGFPDGHLTQFERYEKNYYMLFILPFLGLTGNFLYQGAQNIFHQKAVSNTFVALFIYLCFIYGIHVLGMYQLGSGAGG